MDPAGLRRALTDIADAGGYITTASYCDALSRDPKDVALRLREGRKLYRKEKGEGR